MLAIGTKVTGSVAGQSFTGAVETTYANGSEIVYTVATDQTLTMPSGRKVRKAITGNVKALD